MFQTLKNNWYIAVVVLIFLFMFGIGVYRNISQRPEATTDEQQVAEVMEEPREATEGAMMEEATDSAEATDSGEHEASIKASYVTTIDNPAGESVTVATVRLDEEGFVVIHEDKDGAPGAILGASRLLPASLRLNVAVELSRATLEGESLYAMLHLDDGDGEFDAALDEPIRDSAGRIVMQPFEILGVANPAELGE